MTSLTLPVNRPRDYQLPFWRYMQGGGKRAVLVWPRRHGKDECAGSWTATAALRDTPAVYWHMLPEYAQGRKAVWTAVNPHSGKRRIDEWFPAPIRKATREKPMEIELVNGALWQVVGSDSFNRLMGSSVKGVVFSEYALANPLAWAYIRPILAENDGWAVFISTPRGRNHLHAMFEHALASDDWFAERLTARSTGVFTPEQLAAERAAMIAEQGEDSGDAQFRQEYLCDWSAALVGAYYTREFSQIDEDGRITDVPYDPGLPVWTAWDLGVGDQTAIWFAQIDRGGTVRVIDCEVASGVSVDHYAKLVLDKPYVYARHIVPHDAHNRDWSAIGGKTRIEILEDLGVRPLEELNRDNVDDGIQLVRRLLSRCVFDEKKTSYGVSALRSYRRQWSEKFKRFEPRPLHDWASDPADAFRYLATGLPDRVGLHDAPARRRDRYAVDDDARAGGGWAF